MTYEEARAFMTGQMAGVHLGLDRIRNLLRELGNPEQKVKFIHIAGTNGKGSIAAYLAASLREAGFRTGMYTSPVVYFYREQYRINGQMISEEEYTALAEQIRLALERMEKEGRERPSAFEMETALAFLFFAGQKCDYAVLECGMGGRDDATNVIPAPVLAVFASISMDHMQFLGNTTEEIARTKAGIIKRGCMAAVTSGQRDEVNDVLASVCRTEQVPFVTGDPSRAELRSSALDGVTFRYKGREIRTPLAGACQVENAITAFEALKVLKKKEPSLTDEVILRGISAADWHGRFARIARNPDFLVDGAHNPRAAHLLRQSVLSLYPDTRKIFILGVFSDKDYAAVIRETCDLADAVICTETPDNERALPAEKLADTVRELFPDRLVRAEKNIPDALHLAFQLAGPEDMILSFGSLSNVGEITRLVRNRE